MHNKEFFAIIFKHSQSKYHTYFFLEIHTVTLIPCQVLFNPALQVPLCLSQVPPTHPGLHAVSHVSPYHPCVHSCVQLPFIISQTPSKQCDGHTEVHA